MALDELELMRTLGRIESKVEEACEQRRALFLKIDAIHTHWDRCTAHDARLKALEDAPKKSSYLAGTAAGTVIVGIIEAVKMWGAAKGHTP